MASYETNAMALALCVTHNINVILWGNPGHGKTSVITQLARDFGFHLETIVASLRDPTDFSGAIIEHEGTTFNAPPRFARDVVAAAERGQASICLYDELSTATPATQAALLRVVLEKVAGDLHMPESTRSIGTANPPDIAADGWELTPPTANRFTHLNWALDTTIVTKGFSGDGFPKINFPMTAKTALIPYYYILGKRIVAAFLTKYPTMLDTLNAESFGSGASADFSPTNYAFASPRSWENAAKIYAAYKMSRTHEGKELPHSVLSTLILGTVGEVAGNSFLGYLKTMELQDPKNILLNGEAVKDPGRTDIAVAFLAELEHFYVTQQGKSDPLHLWQAYGTALASIAKYGYADATFSAARRWSKKRPQGAILSDYHTEHLTGVLKEMRAG